ncbi:MAG TPA: TIGR03619 family F420-dependent LLM class oxidoreductase [Amycolatopsis sp.]|nr:TIGR03619 family F420-dependent LLM class oxidoreductase [Amycolatopsis sp.]
MKFAVQHGIGDPAWRPEILDGPNVRSWARAVEDSGWDAIAFTDHPAPSAKWVHADGEGSSALFSSLAFCAAVTQRIKLLTWVLVLPFRNPFVSAHEIATLDRLSSGRLILGLGTGYLRGEFRAAGRDFAHRLADFDEAIEVLRSSWDAGDIKHEVAFTGRTFATGGTVAQPVPVQLPHPPLWIHGNSVWGLERAARYAQGCLFTLTDEVLSRTIRTAMVPDLAAVRGRLDVLAERLGRRGRALRDMEIAVAGLWPKLDARAGWDAGRIRADVDELERMGVTWVTVVVAGDAPAVAERTVRRFGQEIISAAR